VPNVAEFETLRNKESNAQINVQIGEEEQSLDNRFNSLKGSDENIFVLKAVTNIYGQC